MNKALLDRLSRITDEERAFLDGRTTIDRQLYMQDQSNIINAGKLLSAGKLITLRPNTRFIHFPEHTHDYVEVVYMWTGMTTHIVSGKRVDLHRGELLFLNQRASHEVLKSGGEDVGVNFIVLPEFFNTVLSYMGEEETPLRRFLVDCLCGQSTGTGFLHFKVADIPVIQNQVENLLFALLEETPNKQKISQMTMALLFLQLIGYAQTLSSADRGQADLVKILQYIEDHYVSGSLTELAGLLHYDLYSLSREIKRKTGKTYTQLVQEKRLAQAAFLLKNTDRNVDDIALAVGYENMGYFHRIFKATFGLSPRGYRVQIR